MNHLSYGVIGSGSFATAIVKLLSENLNKVYWNVRTEEIKNFILKYTHNPNYLSSIDFDLTKLKITTDINQLIESSEILIFATPSIYLPYSINQIKSSIKGKIFVSGIKGIIPKHDEIVGHYFHNHLNISYEDIIIITGPCHAEEIAMERFSYLTVAGLSENKVRMIASVFETQYLKVTISDDIFGTEYSAVLKNIFAIASGISHGLGYGDNFHAVLMSNSIREMERFLKSVYPLSRDIKNSAYLGDLLVTGYSKFSRNRMLGTMIGKGYTVKSTLLEMNMIAEGYYATQTIHRIIKKNEIHAPIIQTVFKILFKEQDPKKLFKKLSEDMD